MGQSEASDSARAFKLLADTTQAALARIDAALVAVRECEEAHHRASEKVLMAMRADAAALNVRVQHNTDDIKVIRTDCKMWHPVRFDGDGGGPKFWRGVNARFVIIAILIGIGLIAVAANARGLESTVLAVLGHLLGK